MTGTIEKYISLAGIDDVLVTAEFDASYVDNGIGSYECHGYKGVHHDYGWEIDDVYGLELCDTPANIAREWVDGSGFPKQNRKRYIKAKRRLARQIQREFAKLDPNDEDVFDNDELIEACGEPPSDDCDYDDWDD